MNCWTRRPGERRSSARAGVASAASAVAAAGTSGAISVSFVMVSRRRGAPFTARPGALRPRRGRSAPAELQPLGGVDRLEALHWLVGDELHASVEELEARGGLRLLAGLAELHHRLHALRCHAPRVLLRARADDAGLDTCHPRSAAVNRAHLLAA